MDQGNAQRKVHDKWWQRADGNFDEGDNHWTVLQEDVRSHGVGKVETKNEIYGVWGEICFDFGSSDDD